MNDLSFSKNNFLQFIISSLKNDTLNHAFILEISNYDFDFKFILNIIKIIHCSNNCSYYDLNCSKCSTCGLIDNFNYSDLYIINPFKDENVNIISDYSSKSCDIYKEDILDAMSELSNKSLYGKKRILLICHSELLNLYSSNTLLKFLEEPPEDIIIIFLTYNRFCLLDTLLSRCLAFNICDYNNNYEFDELTFKFVDFIISGSLFENYDYILKNIFIDKYVCIEKLREVVLFFIYYINGYINNELYIYNKLFNVKKEKIVDYIDLIGNESSKLSFNINYKLFLDSLFAKIMLI